MVARTRRTVWSTRPRWAWDHRRGLCIHNGHISIHFFLAEGRRRGVAAATGCQHNEHDRQPTQPNDDDPLSWRDHVMCCNCMFEGGVRKVMTGLGGTGRTCVCVCVRVYACARRARARSSQGYDGGSGGSRLREEWLRVLDHALEQPRSVKRGTTP